ncbi:MAG: hypothetical protein PHX83_17340 [Acidobacteriia bacterium]|nr:hypothetical protein [Terriglobia bacterium]
MYGANIAALGSTQDSTGSVEFLSTVSRQFGIVGVPTIAVQDGMDKTLNAYRIYIRLFYLVVFSCLGLPFASSQPSSDIPEIIRRAAHNQDQSMAVRDHTRYRQQLTVQRFDMKTVASNSASEIPPGQKLGERSTVVTVEPSLTPDEKGRYEVLVRVVSDTDDQGRPKAQVDPKAQPGLLVEVLWDEVFFPLQEEKLPFLKFESITSADPNVVQFHFEPKGKTSSIILASGTVTLDRKTSTIERLHIESLQNLQSLNKLLGRIESLSADVEFKLFRGIWSLPNSASGRGVSRLPHLDGLFTFQFEESGYEPVMKIPDPESTP